MAFQLAFTILAQAIIIRKIGVGVDTDCLVAAQALPIIFSAILQAGLQSAWLPRFSASVSNTIEWKGLIGLALGQAALLSFIAFGILFGSSFFWLPWFYSKFTSLQIYQTQSLLFIFCSVGFFTVLTSQTTLAMRVMDKFMTLEWLNLIISIAVLLLIYELIVPGAIILVAIISFSRAVSIFLIQSNFLGWPQIRVIASLSEKSMWIRMSSVFLGASIYKMSPLVDKYFAAQAPPGILSLFNFSQLGIKGLVVIFDRSIAVTHTAKFGAYVKDSKFEHLKRSCRSGVIKIAWMTLAFILCMLLGKSLFIYLAVKVLLVTEIFALDLWWLCLLLVGYLLVGASGNLPVAVFHALGDTKTPVKIGLIGFGVGLFVKAACYDSYGLKGMVLGTSIYYTFNMVLMMYLSEKRINEAIFR